MRSRLGRGIVLVLAVVACLVGGGASTYLTYEYLQTTPLTGGGGATTQAAETASAGEADDSASHAGDKGQEEKGTAQSADGEISVFDQVCTAYSTWSCEKVSQSPYGRFPFGSKPPTPGVPTAELGLVYFLFVLSWFVVVGSPSASRWWLHLIFTGVTAFSVGFSLLLEYIMWFQLSYRCPFCMIAHVASGLVFVFALLLWPRREAAVCSQGSEGCLDSSDGCDAPEGNRTDAFVAARVAYPSFKIVFIAFLVAGTAIGGQHAVWWGIASQKASEKLSDSACQKDLKRQQATVRYWQKQFRRYDDRWQHVVMAWQMEPEIPLKTEGEPIFGPPDAKNTLVLFSDVQCPACGRLEEKIRSQILPKAQKYGGLKIIFKHFPICVDCNDVAYHNLHPKACLAARAVEAARMVGGDRMFWRMHDTLIMGRTAMKDADKEWFVKVAGRLKLDTEAFSKAMDSEEAMARIRSHVEESQKLGVGILKGTRLEEMKVNSTPTVFLNNRRLKTTRITKAWEMIMQASSGGPMRRTIQVKPKQ